SFIKFFHLLMVLGVLGSTFFCLVLIASNNPAWQNTVRRFNKAMLCFALLAMTSGTLLVYPKHYTFHTPWIMAAYFLVLIFVGVVLMLRMLMKKSGARWLWASVYLFLLLPLAVLIHDAVSKTTVL
ncbi:MAG: hypothetical protein ABI597_09715, partial [Gammaproteobacteria bacterium]